VNFGIVYGQTAFGLSKGLGIERREADQYIKAYFERYSGVRRFIDQTIVEVRRTGVSVNMYGRRRPIPDMNSRNPNARGFAERTAVNTPLQGTAADMIKAAAHHDALHELPKITTLAGGVRRIIDRPPVITHPTELTTLLAESTVHSYRDSLQEDRRVLLDRYRLVDSAMKVVGIGSVGLAAFVGLLEGSGDDNPLFLQAKEAQASVLERFLQPCEYENQGERVVRGQRLMQGSSDIFLGWQRVRGEGGIERDFYMRQLRDWKGSLDAEKAVPRGMMLYARICGETLARAHARAGDRVEIAAYLGKSDVFDEAMADFADVYADQNEADYAQFLAAIDSGRLEALQGL
jgi:uncharacterized protein (DUF2252 family)